MLVKIGLYAAIGLLLAISIFYQVYSVDRQLSFIHTIPKGILSLSPTVLSSISDLNSNTPFTISYTQNPQTNLLSQFRLQANNSTIFGAGDGSNFIAILKAEGNIEGRGDSFYHVTDRFHVACVRQSVDRIEGGKGKVYIYGEFLDCPDSKYQIALTIHNENKVEVVAKSMNSHYNRLLIYFEHKKFHNYFGLGQQFSYLNLGHDRPYSLFVREKGVGRTDQPETFTLNAFYGAGGSYYNSYSPAPIWYSLSLQPVPNSKKTQTRTLAYFARTWAYTVWMNNQLYLWDTQVQLYIFMAPSVKQVVGLVSGENGYTPPVPDWVNEGAIVGLQGGTEAVMSKYGELKKAGTKVAGLWLQDWVSKRKSLGFSRLWWNWQLDTNHYKNWDEMRSKLEQQGVNLLIYMNPMLTNVEQKKQHYRTNFYKLALQQKCFVTQKGGKIFATSAFSDWNASLFQFDRSEEVNQFYQDMLRSAIKETEAKGLMVDFGEAYPVEGMDQGLEDMVKRHNEYPTSYHRIVRQVLDEFKDKQIYTFSRAGYLYAPKYTLSLWAGDQAMNFKKHSGLPSCLAAMLSSSLIGYSNTHCDIGGYSSYEILWHKTSVRSEVLMSRWMQLGVFSPVFRTHEGNRPDTSLQVYSNPRISAQFSFYSQIFSALSSYRKAQSLSSESAKLPLIRPFFLQNEHNPEALTITDQYYLGQDVLVSPLLAAESKRKYYLPIGKWVDLWDHGVVLGCDCLKETDSFLPPVFIKYESEHRKELVEKVAGIIQKFKTSIQYLKPISKTHQL